MGWQSDAVRRFQEKIANWKVEFKAAKILKKKLANNVDPNISFISLYIVGKR